MFGSVGTSISLALIGQTEHWNQDVIGEPSMERETGLTGLTLS